MERKRDYVVIKGTQDSIQWHRGFFADAAVQVVAYYHGHRCLPHRRFFRHFFVSRALYPSLLLPALSFFIVSFKSVRAFPSSSRKCLKCLSAGNKMYSTVEGTFTVPIVAAPSVVRSYFCFAIRGDVLNRLKKNGMRNYRCIRTH